MNEFEELQNEKKKELKFEIELQDEADKLEDLEQHMNDEDKAAIELEEIGIGHNTHKAFGGNNLNR